MTKKSGALDVEKDPISYSEHRKLYFFDYQNKPPRSIEKIPYGFKQYCMMSLLSAKKQHELETTSTCTKSKP